MEPASLSRPSRPKRVVTWLIAGVLTLGMLVYQRMTGPTYPKSVHETFAGGVVSGKLVRTHAGDGGAVVEVGAPAPIEGTLVWRRYPTQDPWTTVPMRREGDRLAGELPHMPIAGKLEYTVRLASGSAFLAVPQDGSAIIRYRNDVPVFVLIPHILCMFLGLLFGMRLLFGALAKQDDLMGYFPWLMTFSLAGGLILGPLVQKYAFDAFWTGWPVGEDLTDTKTLVACAAWGLAWWVSVRASEWRRTAIVAASIVMLAVYLIPHSARGSQIDWSKVPANAASSR